jgi:hypothetical protein
MFSKAQQPQQTPSTKATTPFFKPEPTFKPLATEPQVQRNVMPLSPVASNPRLPIQAKLTVGQPNDKYEQEADAMADKVVQRWAMPDVARPSGRDAQETATITPFNINAAQRACAACAKEDKDHIQRKESGEMTASPSVESRLSATKGGGNPLPESTRTHMESSIGADFSNVRIHTSGEAVQLSQDLSAHAFTHGSDVYFNSGKFAPDTDSGRHLLAHELTHTVQQGKLHTVNKLDRKPSKKTKKSTKVILKQPLAVSQEGGLRCWAAALASWRMVTNLKPDIVNIHTTQSILKEYVSDFDRTQAMNPEKFKSEVAPKESMAYFIPKKILDFKTIKEKLSEYGHLYLVKQDNAFSHVVVVYGINGFGDDPTTDYILIMDPSEGGFISQPLMNFNGHNLLVAYPAISRFDRGSLLYDADLPGQD